MNIQALNSAISPLQLWTKKSNHSNHVRENDWQTRDQNNLEKGRRYRHDDVQKLVENRLTDSIQKAIDTQFVRHLPILARRWIQIN